MAKFVADKSSRILVSLLLMADLLQTMVGTKIYLDRKGRIREEEEETTTQTLVINYDCSSYFRFEVVDSMIDKVIAHILNTNCPNSKQLRITSLNFLGRQCSIQYTHTSDLFDLEADEVCRDTVNKILTSAPTMAWGAPWGCEQTDLYVSVTPYYLVRVRTKNMTNMGLNKQWSTRCTSNAIQMDKEININCKMSKYGGYQWQSEHSRVCEEPSLQKITRSLFYSLMKAPLRCQLLIILLFGILNPNVETFVPKSMAISFSIDALENYCPKLERWEFEAMYNELENIFDHIIYRLVYRSLHSRNSFEAIHTIGSVIQLYGRYLQQYHGTATEFHIFSRNIFCAQHVPNLDDHVEALHQHVAVEMVSAEYPVMVCCTSAIYRPVQYKRNRLVRGLCHSQSPYKLQSEVVYRLRIYESQHAQSGRYQCGLSKTLDNHNFLEPFNLKCSLIVEPNGTLVCLCKGFGFSALLQLGHDEDDMRHAVFNPLKSETSYWDKFVLVGLMFFGSFVLTVTHLYRPALVLYSGSSTKVKHDRIHLHMSSHLLFINGLRLCSVLVCSKWDDEENCVQLGPLQFGLHWTAECVNTLRVVSLFIVTRSHRPLGLMLRLTSALYCAGISAGFIVYLAFPFEFYHIHCFPSSIVMPMCVPFILLNGLTLVLVGAYMSARPDRSRDELLGFGMTSIPGLVSWSVVSTAPPPGLHPRWQFAAWYYLMIAQATMMFTYHMIAKPKQIAYMGGIIHVIASIHWTTLSRKATQESSLKADETEPYMQHTSHSCSSSTSDPLKEVTYSSGVLSSLEFDKREIAKKNLSKINRSRSRSELAMWTHKASWRRSSSQRSLRRLPSHRSSGRTLRRSASRSMTHSRPSKMY